MLHLSRKKHLGIADDLIRQNATPLRKSAPWAPNISAEDASCTAPATKNASVQILFKSRTPAIVFEILQHPHVLVTFQWMHNPLHLPHKTTSERPKCLRDPQFLTLLTSKRASRHNAVHFFDISTSKSAPRQPVFNTFYFQMCFAPQSRALFRHLNFQNCSEPLQFLTHFTSKCASRHNAVHFFNISTSKSGPTLRCFVSFHFEIGFAPQRRATFHLSSPQMSPHPPL